LRSMVLSNTPIGMNQAGIEKALTNSFRRKWRVINYVSTEGMSRLGFSVPVSSGDYYVRSDFAVVWHGFYSDVITVFFFV
jgi:hypothetical protein